MPTAKLVNISQVEAPAVYRYGEQGYRAAWDKAYPRSNGPEDWTLCNDGVARIFVTGMNPDGHYVVYLFEGTEQIAVERLIAPTHFEPETKNRIGRMGAYREVPDEVKTQDAIDILVKLHAARHVEGK